MQKTRGFHTGRCVVVALFVVTGAACIELPDDLRDYREKCLRMNIASIEPTTREPHDGYKQVSAFNAAEENRDDTMIVHDCCPDARYRDGAFVWVIASARKADGKWRWNQYTRNVADEAFAEN